LQDTPAGAFSLFANLFAESAAAGVRETTKKGQAYPTPSGPANSDESGPLLAPFYALSSWLCKSRDSWHPRTAPYPHLGQGAAGPERLTPARNQAYVVA